MPVDVSELIRKYIETTKRHFQEEIEIREKTVIHACAVNLNLTEAQVREIWNES